MNFHFDASVSAANKAVVNAWENAIKAGFSGAGIKPVNVSVDGPDTNRELIVLQIPDAFSDAVATVHLLPTDPPTHVELECKRKWSDIAQQNVVTRGAHARQT